jgi:uncharacterized protein (DUF1015 family)
MPRIAPFEALVYDTDVSGPLEEVTARPYDVINEAGRRDYASRSPYNVVRVDLPDPELEGGYDGAATRLREWRDGGALRLRAPGYVAYEMIAPPGITVRGVLCALELEPWGGAIVPHEEVMAGPVRDRLRLLRATRTHLSPIYGTVPGPHRDLDLLLRATGELPPEGEVVDQEGVRHRTWWLPSDAPIDRWLGTDRLLIADGHHRYTTALAYRNERHASDGPGPWESVLAFLVDAGSTAVPVLPYHRIQRAGEVLGGGRPAQDLPDVLAGVDDATGIIGSCVRTSDGMLRWSLHHVDGTPPAVRSLHARHLDATAPGDALTFTHDVDEAVGAVLAGDAVAAYLLPPTTPATIMAVAGAGGRLPRKSTFFWPKPRTGMVMFPLQP